MSYRPADWIETQLELGVIGDAFKLLLRRWQEYALLGFVTMAVSGVFMIPGYVGFIAAVMSNRQPDIGMILGFYGAIYGGVLVGITFAYPFIFGIVNFTIREVRTGDATLADAWLPLKRYGRFALAGLGLTLIQGIAAIVGCGIGGLVVGGLLLYVMPIMVNEDLGFGDAIAESYARIKDQWLMAGVAYLLASIVAVLGEIACIIGIVLSYPLMFIIPTMLYLRHFRRPFAESHSPYPRAGHPGYGMPPQQGIGEEGPPPGAPEERPTPPTD